ncbi:hypothetical protein GTO89_03795 [Heliobacterium gestii]|uniref:Uncharacterized protein n=1 Tax=Heliomicrobium gestii TaxID=2699 RepID=A0A845LB54_HELGE|nr:hypothetical protein [Heliomicrobium gestii]MBM7865920.1 hypothetical protein [Heliomicrobium gestii]MZP42160.1 hypothetical protein [Heliomicrobium gestii]
MQADQNNSHPQTGIPVPTASVVIYPPVHWPGQTTPPTGFRSVTGQPEPHQPANQSDNQQGGDGSQQQQGASQGQSQGQEQGQNQRQGQGKGQGQRTGQSQGRGQAQKNNPGPLQGKSPTYPPGQDTPYTGFPAPFTGGFPALGSDSSMMVGVPAGFGAQPPAGYAFGTPAYGYSLPAAQPMYAPAAPMLSAGMNALTDKDLLLLMDLMAQEMNAARKCRHFARSVGDEAVAAALHRAGQMHQRHLKVMIQHCQVGGIPASLWS